mmetsp:Transcript_32830/g.67768  ORF Transcript_32830/g.67768 Transcript_32830/m.67768 type:complete len:225 (+) Transcript_32830:1-675(+)
MAARCLTSPWLKPLGSETSCGHGDVRLCRAGRWGQKPKPRHRRNSWSSRKQRQTVPGDEDRGEQPQAQRLLKEAAEGNRRCAATTGNDDLLLHQGLRQSALGALFRLDGGEPSCTTAGELGSREDGCSGAAMDKGAWQPQAARGNSEAADHVSEPQGCSGAGGLLGPRPLLSALRGVALPQASRLPNAPGRRPLQARRQPGMDAAPLLGVSRGWSIRAVGRREE